MGPNELLRIYVILQDELNRFLCEEKDKLKQLIVKDNGEKVAKGDFTKQFNSIFGNTLLGVVDAWYYKILQSNIYDILLSLHDKLEFFMNPRKSPWMFENGYRNSRVA